MSDSTSPGPALSLRLGHSCYKELTWECELQPKTLATTLAVALPELDYRETTGPGVIRVFEGAGGHTVVLVPRTGRVQIRLHYLTAQEARIHAAAGVARDIRRALAGPQRDTAEA